jgi:hypothetical protein
MQNEQFNAPQLDMNQLPWVSCSCGGMIFDSGVMVKRLSPLMSPTGKEEILPAEIIICKSCGMIPDFYATKIKGIPEELISKTPINE